MAKAKKKAKDLDPKGRGKNVRGGNLSDDQKNIGRSVTSITSKVTNIKKDGVRINPL